MFNWNDLVFFLELARQSRLMPAARRLKVDHTTVSRRISELEKDLSIKLFDRKPDGFVLTEQGHRLFAVAERIEVEANGIPHIFGAEQTAATGRVRVATMEGIGAFYLGERFAELAELQPGIVVELVTERHLINLSKREADLFISFVQPVGQRLVVRKLGGFRLALFASADYVARRGFPKDRSELPAHTFVDYVEDLIAIQPVHWLLDVLEPSQRIVPVEQHARAAKRRGCRSRHRAAAAVFGKMNPKLLPVLAEEVKVYRDVYLSVHEDLEFVGRIRSVLRHLTNVFTRDAAFFNEF